MKTKNILVVLISCFFAFSCMTDPVYETDEGENIVPQETMEKMIYDIHLADAIITSKIMKSKNNVVVDSMIYESIYEKHTYSKEDFEKTLLFYTHNNMDTLNAMYDRVIQRFIMEQEQIY